MKSRYLISICILVMCLVVDYYTKQWGLTLESLHYNEGFIMGAFSQLPDSIRVIALGSFSGIIFILFVLLMYIIPRRGQWLKFGLSFLVGGMLGNVSDKVIYGKTVDFIPFIVGDFTPTLMLLISSCGLVPRSLSGWYLPATISSGIPIVFAEIILSVLESS